MLDGFDKLPVANEPIYSTTSPNEDIDLFHGPAKIKSSSGIEITGDCLLKCRWLPSPKVRFDFNTNSNRMAAVGIFAKQRDDSVQLEFDAFKPPGSCLITSSGETIRGQIFGGWSVAKSNELKVVYFHLANWPHVHGSFVRFNDSSRKPIAIAGRFELRVDDWQVVIDPVHNHSELTEAIGEAGGFGITHVGLLSRSSQKFFDADEAENILLALTYFFAFARGGWSGPFLPVGFDTQMGKVWWNFGLSLCDRWKDTDNWFGHESGKSLTQLWPMFFQRWQDENWKNTLKTAIWWYVAGAEQAGGSDAALIVAQAGLELISWVKLVETEKVLSPADYEKLRAGEKLQLLVEAMKMNTDIDPSRKALLELAADQGWSTAPWAIAAVRNGLIHPKKREHLDGQGMAVYEAYTVAMHYFELAILYVCGYGGSYTNRLTTVWRGTTECVPWAT